jgi:hypothetical protein
LLRIHESDSLPKKTKRRKAKPGALVLKNFREFSKKQGISKYSEFEKSSEGNSKSETRFFWRFRNLFSKKVLGRCSGGIYITLNIIVGEVLASSYQFYQN